MRCTHAFSSCEAAIDKLYQEEGAELPDIILMDIQMPTMDGLEAMRQLRTEAAFKRTPIIALTADVRKGIDEQLLRWKGIEATERLAESGNSKIVVIGGADGLPLILNTEN